MQCNNCSTRLNRFKVAVADTLYCFRCAPIPATGGLA